MQAKTKSRVLKGVRVGACVVAAGVVIAANVAAVLFGESLESFLSNDKIEVTEQEVKARSARGTQLAQDIEGEGIVLLKNEDNTLPLSSAENKVNVFGWSSTQWIGSGSGSGGVTGEVDGLLDALVDNGISYNEELTSMYRDFKSTRPYVSEGSLLSHDYEFCRLYEPDIYDKNFYSDDLLARAKDYSGTAIVVLGRVAGESIDCPNRQYRVTDKSGDVKTYVSRNYLELSLEEEHLLSYVGANFDHVIVVVNSTNTMELGQLETTPGVDAALLCGTTGQYGAQEVVRVMRGETNPSGRTTDTFTYDFSTAPSWANAGLEGEGAYTNSFGVYPADGTLNVNVSPSDPYKTARFVDYREGIYVGYRWYETADEEGYWDSVDNAFGKGYEGVVQYPFGYGLSYTSFDWQVISNSPSTDFGFDRNTTFTYVVRVTNTGSKAGKDVVELYYTPPYTKGGIEKPSCVLAAFAKTKELGPGESQDVELSFSADSMASYDCYDANNNGFSGYELEAGAYTLSLRRDVHSRATCDFAEITYVLSDPILCGTDAVTGQEVQNRFTGSSATDGFSVDGSTSEGEITYLSRSDFAATFPQAAKNRWMTDELIAHNLYHAPEASGDEVLDDAPGVISNAQSLLVSDLKTGELTDLGKDLGANYNDERWDTLLDALSTQDMERIVLHGYSNSGAITQVGKARTKDLDGPAQAGSFHQFVTGVGYPNPTVLAQTWNVELAREYGRQVGMECANIGIDGWYAPSINLHRTPVGGRNYEYFSEDPLLSGIFGGQITLGSREAGTFCYIKHLALNEQDSYRDSLYTWLTEQSLRELYLRPFQIAVEDYGATGIMSSYNRVGATWAGGSSALLTQVLRNEWGFQGSVITDYCDHHQYMNATQMLMAGGDLYMDGVFRNGAFTGSTSTPEFHQNLRRAAKDIMYIWLNARSTNLTYNALAQANGGEKLVRPLKVSRASVVSVGISVIDGITGTLVAVAVVHAIRKRRPRKARPDDRDGDPYVNIDVANELHHSG
ncbi:MAG: glycoside hydrolase family 3 N-terminal domain-containing protein [Atopobiaceae bacterium]|jgi:beta-glucosidase